MFCYLNLLSACVGERSSALQRAWGHAGCFQKGTSLGLEQSHLRQSLVALVQVDCYVWGQTGQRRGYPCQAGHGLHPLSLWVLPSKQ